MKSICVLGFCFCVLYTIATTRVLAADLRFTNLQCDAFHPEFAKFLKCRLKVVKRGVISLNIDVELYQVPVNNITVNLSLHKKSTTFRPFLYNETIDFCKFMASKKHGSLSKFFFNALKKQSNINHSCPYEDNIIVDNLILYEDTFRYFPLPQGEYMIQTKVAAYNDWKADVKTYFSLINSFGK
ncbi:uncharacterized protein LOC109612857 [Musca domestica]|uniref:Uncharacterized protein LOC109612857 n=1 Tax=Musca domestica TaxID=7370 RepID=A0A9J7IH51_MUSDO|nr:uncharacterized protein LOC109612857 [Musca domestica]